MLSLPRLIVSRSADVERSALTLTGLSCMSSEYPLFRPKSIETQILLKTCPCRSSIEKKKMRDGVCRPASVP